MSEEEIIRYLDNYKDCNCDLREYQSCIECENKTKQAIQGLLDLYNKQKEELKEYKYADNFTVDWLEHSKAMHEKYIKKDKIRELLNKYDKDIAWANADDHYYFVRYIKELLEGETNE